MPRRRAALVLIALAACGCAKPSPLSSKQTDRPTAATQPGPSSRAAAKIVDYAPGVRIDFRVPQVEVACEVILREGDLELFAYARAPVPKEHESILRTEAAPSVVYQALGLIGLRPGNPARYDPETKTLRPASGDPVDVFVRYESNGRTRVESACDWMIEAAARRPMRHTSWRFTGSEKMKSGMLFADYEGTLVTVVDFTSSLVGLPASHTSSDADLWLVARTDAIPPLGTSVTLLLRSSE